MTTNLHRARRLLAAGAIGMSAVLGLAACENTTPGGDGTVDSEEMSEQPMDDGMPEDSMDEGMEETEGMEGMTDGMSEDSMDDTASEEPMDDEG